MQEGTPHLNVCAYIVPGSGNTRLSTEERLNATNRLMSCTTLTTKHHQGTPDLLTDSGVPAILLCGATKDHSIDIREDVGVQSGEIEVLDPWSFHSNHLAPSGKRSGMLLRALLTAGETQQHCKAITRLQPAAESQTWHSFNHKGT